MEINKNNLSILYAEDDLIIQNNISKILNMLFKKVYIANDGEEAFKIYNQNKPDIILTDFLMPKMNGYELTKNIRKICNKIPIVILSNYTDKEKLLKCIPLNLTEYLEKPIQYEVLLATLEKCRSQLENNTEYFNISNKLNYNFETKKLTVYNEEISLTQMEIEILEYLILNKNKLLSKEKLSFLVYKDDIASDNALKNIIYRLRKKIGKEFIINDRNLGYTLKVEELW